MILDPLRPNLPGLDARSREIVEKTIAFFEAKGKRRLREDDLARVWYADFLDFVAGEGAFADLLTPPAYGGPQRALGHLPQLLLQRGARLLRALLLVHLAGLDPRPRADLDERQRGGEAPDRRAAARGRHLRLRPLGEGARRRHLLDRDDARPAAGRRLPRARRQVLHRQRQRGRAGLGLRQGRRAPTSTSSSRSTRRDPTYELVKNVVASQSYVAEFRLHDTPVGRGATSCCAAPRPGTPRSTPSTSASTTWAGRRSASATHAFYEALNHAADRRLYGMAVTDFPHVRQNFTDAWARLVAMKLFASAPPTTSASPRPRTAATCSSTRCRR